jgi:hypothetical protein
MLRGKVNSELTQSYICLHNADSGTFSNIPKTGSPTKIFQHMSV